MAIDVGIFGDMSAIWAGAYTIVTKVNSANATGLITSCAIWANGTCANVEIAAFTAVGNSLTTRGYVSLPNLASGNNAFSAPTNFAPFEIRAGDYIGVYFTAAMGVGVDGEATGGGGIWRSNLDQIPCSGRTFDVNASAEISIYATGVQLGQIHIGAAWKTIQNVQINVGDSWKQMCDMEINIGDSWKKGVY